MILDGGLLYAGTVDIIDSDALLFKMIIDGQRATRPYILCQEELLNSAVCSSYSIDAFCSFQFREIRLNAESDLHIGQRVCAIWSKLPALYPGTLTSFGMFVINTREQNCRNTYNDLVNIRE